ncbi:MAG: trypsin-like serine protease [Acidobacteria bacterium]|nr:trypsin-like serine protease [Acidobacteriota bacterium]
MNATTGTIATALLRFPRASALLALLVAMPATGIVIRHDVPDERYVELGARYPAVCKVGRRMGDGTLVGPQQILTAAHVARGLVRNPSEVVICEGVEYGVVAVFIHPDWTDMGPHDVAVVELDAVVPGVAPLALYAGSEEAGAQAVMVGHGATGAGNSRTRSEDGRRRGATNVIEEATDRHIRFHFDAPPDATELEGIPGPGDSGGPAILSVGGVDYVVGVSSLGEPGDNGPGTYGANDYFVRVSTHLDWIRDALDGGAEPYSSPAATVPESAAGDRLSELVALVAAGADADISGFVEESMVAAPDALERRVTALTELIADFEGATLRRIVDQAEDRVVASFDTTDGVQLLGVEIDTNAPYRIRGVIRGRF